MAFNFSLGSPVGGDNSDTTVSNTSSIPIPDLADISKTLEVSTPRISFICVFTLSGSAAGKSILFKTGIII